MAQEKKRADKCEERLDEIGGGGGSGGAYLVGVRNGKRNGSPGSFEDVKDIVDLRRSANDARWVNVKNVFQFVYFCF